MGKKKTVDNSQFKKGIKPKEFNGLLILPSRGYYQISNEFGRAKGRTQCVFCDASVEFYIWSMAGSGKKCYNCGIRIGYMSSSCKIEDFKFPNQYANATI